MANMSWKSQKRIWQDADTGARGGNILQANSYILGQKLVLPQTRVSIYPIKKMHNANKLHRVRYEAVRRGELASALGANRI